MPKPMFGMNEKGNTWTHLVGVVFALSSIWMVWPAARMGWEMTMGVVFFIVGMFLMFLSSTIYHWLPEGKAKRVLRKCDHISIYVMIACSYTPICIGIVGGWLGWMVFGILWTIALTGSVVKVFALGKYPRLSLAAYLTMGWSGVLIMPQVVANASEWTLSLILLEGLFYTAGTYFFSHDKRPNYHAIWHVFVLLGAIAHWSAVLFLLIGI